MSLQSADRPIVDVVAFFAKYGLEVGLLVPTATGLVKSIMDSHATLRDYLVAHNVHDYLTQRQGPDDKKLKDAWMVTREGMKHSRASLYRPNTKTGDPRIWFSGLPNYAKAGNVVAVLAAPDGLYIINASDLDLLDTAKQPSSPLALLLQRLKPKPNPAVAELLEMLRSIAGKRYVRTLRPGPTGVGYTLETMLGIRANSSKEPDYKGIEIKSTRVGSKGKAKTRGSLFSAIPDWNQSAFDNPVKLLAEFGWTSKGKLRLTCSLSNTPNTKGLFLEVDDEPDILHALKHMDDSDAAKHVVQWALPRLRSVLAAKHGETFWVKARTQFSGVAEEFQYYEAQHTMRPLIGNFSPLIQAGHIEFDFTLSMKSQKNGQPRARDHGYLFKISEQNRSLLFPTFATYPLLD